MLIIKLDIAQTTGIAAVLLVLGEWIRHRVGVLSRYFIPGPIIGGLVFSLVALVGHLTQTFSFAFYNNITDFMSLVFFTTIGFSASLELLKKGGPGVLLFLVAALGLVLLQNVVGVSLASMLGINPLIGVAAGSVALTGGHGTSSAFGPILAEAGAQGAFPVAIAAATWGLVAGCMIGGPVGKLLMRRNHLSGSVSASAEPVSAGVDEVHRVGQLPEDAAAFADHIDAKKVMYAAILIALSIGFGSLVVKLLAVLGLTVPPYLGPMLVAALVRNIIDWRKGMLPKRQFELVGEVSLAFFLAMALMSVKLWELADVAGPLLLILLVQTAIMFAYAYFVTFRIMGADYDAAVIAAGHCGFGMGATPNAMANMQAFTQANGPSAKAFFVIPLVGSLFIDFFNSIIVTGFISNLR